MKPIELVFWIDSTQIFGWHLHDDKIDSAKKADLTVRSVGFVIHEGDDRIVLATSMSEDSTQSAIVIPIRCITYRQILDPSELAI